jgi:hypothetical protein
LPECDFGKVKQGQCTGYTAKHRYAAYIVMALVNYYRPHRAVVRCKAKMHLLETVDDNFDWDESSIDSLLKELATSLFRSRQYQVFFEKAYSKQEAKVVEDRLAEELANTYRNILKRHQDPVVQSLNALL